MKIPEPFLTNLKIAAIVVEDTEKTKEFTVVL